MPVWQTVAHEVEKLRSMSSIDVSTLENAIQFIDAATATVAECDGVKFNGYTRSVLLDWSVPKIQLEIGPNSYELYRLGNSPVDIREFRHETGAKLCGTMMELLPKR